MYLERLRTVQAWIRIVCGIAMTLTDEASSMMCSQCLFIGMFHRSISLGQTLQSWLWRKADVGLQPVCLPKMTENVIPSLRCWRLRVRSLDGGLDLLEKT